MSSRSFINLCSALTLARFCAEVCLRDIPETDPNQRKLIRTCRRIVDQVTHTRALWTDQSPSSVDLNQIAAKIEYLGDKLLHGDRNITELIAMAITQLTDAEPRLTRPERKRAVCELLAMLEKLNREFDKNLSDHASYSFAGDTTEAWYRVIGL